MTITRRQTLALPAGAAAVLLAGRLPAAAAADEARALLMEFTGGIVPQPGRIALSAPDIAENGNAVQISFSVDSAMAGDDRVESVLIVADGNPRPGVARFHFSQMSAAAAATTRIRLAQSQTLTAVARMSDGSFFADSRQVTVTVGGCTG